MANVAPHNCAQFGMLLQKCSIMPAGDFRLQMQPLDNNTIPKMKYLTHIAAHLLLINCDTQAAPLPLIRL
jgi:hypothetical protein